MAQTALTDVNFQSNAFLDTLTGEFTNQVGLLNAIAMEAPDAYVDPNQKGQFITLPKWNTLSGDLEVITTGVDVTLNKLTDYIDKSVWLERQVAFSAEEIVTIVAGAQKDPTKETATQFAKYMAEKLVGTIYAMLKGVFATTLATTHVFDDYTAGNTINQNGLVAAKQKLGDNSGFLTALCTHSKVASDALVAGIVREATRGGAPDPFITGSMPTILGMNIQESDLLAPVADLYNTFIGRPGSIIYKFGKRDKPMLSNANIIQLGNNIDMELYRNSINSGGIDALIFRMRMMVHVPGVSWNVTTVSPTDAQLATGSNWNKVVSDNKLIKLVNYQSK